METIVIPTKYEEKVYIKEYNKFEKYKNKQISK